MLRINNLKKIYKEKVNIENTIFYDFNLDIEENKISCIFGVSGIGKTTLLNILSGLISYESGNINDFKNKTFSFIFQEPRLLNWKTVYGNIILPLKDKYNKDNYESIANYYINLVNLTEYKNFYPEQLSGGMQQRVSIARAFAYPSDILIMDEPFKSLDYKLKHSLIKSFIKIWSIDKRTVIFVTHDIEEAAYISNNIILLSENRPTKVKKILRLPFSIKERIHLNKSANIIKQIENLLISSL